MRAAVVRDSDGLVVNVISVTDLLHPVDSGQTLIESDEAGPGWTWDGTIFTAPPLLPEPLTPDAQYAAALAMLDPATVTSLAETRAFLTDLKTILGKVKAR